MPSAKTSRLWPVAVVLGGVFLTGVAQWLIEMAGDRVTNNYFFDNGKAADTLAEPIQKALDDFGIQEGADAVFIHAYAPDLSSRERVFSYLDRRVGDYKLALDRWVPTDTRDQMALLSGHKLGKCPYKFRVNLVYLSRFIDPFLRRDQDSLITFPLFSARNDLIGYVGWHTRRDTAARLGKSRLTWRQAVCAKLEEFAGSITAPFERFVRVGGV